mgnify:FL=1
MKVRARLGSEGESESEVEGWDGKARLLEQTEEPYAVVLLWSMSAVDCVESSEAHWHILCATAPFTSPGTVHFPLLLHSSLGDEAADGARQVELLHRQLEQSGRAKRTARLPRRVVEKGLRSVERRHSQCQGRATCQVGPNWDPKGRAGCALAIWQGGSVSSPAGRRRPAALAGSARTR